MNSVLPNDALVFEELPAKVHCRCGCGWSEDLWIENTGTFQRKCWRCGESYQLMVTKLPAVVKELP